MRKVTVILGTILLIGLVACANVLPPLWGAMAFAGSPPTDGSGIMIVFYTINDEQYLFWCDLTAVITDTGGGTWDVDAPQVSASGINQDTVTYDYFKYKEIVPIYDDSGSPLLLYLSDLGLESPTGNDLPHSQHIGVLVAVNTALVKPATVTRKWQGTTFDIQCLVSQSVVDMWIADTLNVGDYVIVSFIDEHPNETELNLAIVVDKVYDSWS